ncbi:ankyrin repeat domain-containing protein [Agrobacterium sp.]|jgi:ankyrin repeat protein|uniref:ankyrin repeat domain-containing protein n=1 Tax=Agrobacterium sp. TaxID=361 RepID=UPI0028B0D883
MKRLLISLLAMASIPFGVATASPATPQVDTVRAFHDAVHEGNVAEVRAMLKTNPALATSEDEYKFQPIHLMDMYFEPDILDLLLTAGADINARNDEGVTILHIITDPDAVSLLVQNGADVEARAANGWTPLIMQANNQQNGPDVVAALLENGANPNAEGNGGETALSFALETGDEDFIKVLKAGGATK